jgi:hypothetical protein
LYILDIDEFDMDWIRDAEKELQKRANKLLGNIEERNIFHIFESLLREMQEDNSRAEEIPFIESKEKNKMDNEYNSDHHKTKNE